MQYFDGDSNYTFRIAIAVHIRKRKIILFYQANSRIDNSEKYWSVSRIII